MKRSIHFLLVVLLNISFAPFLLAHDLDYPSCFSSSGEYPVVIDNQIEGYECNKLNAVPNYILQDNTARVPLAMLNNKRKSLTHRLEVFSCEPKEEDNIIHHMIFVQTEYDDQQINPDRISYQQRFVFTYAEPTLHPDGQTYSFGMSCANEIETIK